MEAVHHPTRVAHRDAIIVGVKGIYRNIPPEPAKAAVGVFVHEFSDENQSAFLCGNQITTSLGTELIAVAHALRMAITIREKNDAPLSGSSSPYHKLSRVVIKSDSEYVVTAMSNWMYNRRADPHVDGRDTR